MKRVTDQDQSPREGHRRIKSFKVCERVVSKCHSDTVLHVVKVKYLPLSLLVSSMKHVTEGLPFTISTLNPSGPKDWDYVRRRWPWTQQRVIVELLYLLSFILDGKSGRLTRGDTLAPKVLSPQKETVGMNTVTKRVFRRHRTIVGLNPSHLLISV